MYSNIEPGFEPVNIQIPDNIDEYTDNTQIIEELTRFGMILVAEDYNGKHFLFECNTENLYLGEGIGDVLDKYKIKADICHFIWKPT